MIQPGSASIGYAYDPGNKRVWRGDSSTGLDEIDFWGGNNKMATYQLSTAIRPTSDCSGDLVMGTKFFQASGVVQERNLFTQILRLASSQKSDVQIAILAGYKNVTNSEAAAKDIDDLARKCIR